MNTFIVFALFSVLATACGNRLPSLENEQIVLGNITTVTRGVSRSGSITLFFREVPWDRVTIFCGSGNALALDNFGVDTQFKNLLAANDIPADVQIWTTGHYVGKQWIWHYQNIPFFYDNWKNTYNSCRDEKDGNCVLAGGRNTGYGWEVEPCSTPHIFACFTS